MEDLLDWIKGVFEKRKGRVGNWASPHFTQRLMRLIRPRLNEFCRSLQVIATYINTRTPLDMKYRRHALNATWKKKLPMTMWQNVFERRLLVENTLLPHGDREFILPGCI